ncbi:MAG: HEAT repeat domain-containing protein [Holophaga sp.]|nr:HEAT repeat domain-containing protein [Holophaga sp.]
MTQSRAFASFVEYFHRAFMAQAHYAQDHPQARHALEALSDLAKRLVEEVGPLELRVAGDDFLLNGAPVSGAPNASQSLVQLLLGHGLSSITFLPNLEEDDLQLLFFMLRLKPQRLQEMGGPDSLLPEGHSVRIDLTQSPCQPLAEAPFSPRAISEDLTGLFVAVAQMTAAPIRPNPRAPWTMEQRTTLDQYGFLVADLNALAGTSDQLGLQAVEPSALRDMLRQALGAIDPLLQGAILLGLPTCPEGEIYLRRALDYLAPEIAAQALAFAQGQVSGSRFDLALAAAGMLQCVRDRDLGIEALKGRLMLEGWSMPDTDELEAAIRWECHGTDTKLHLSLTDRSFFELDAHQLSTLVRQLARGRRVEGLKDLLAELETGFSSPHVERRRLAAEVLTELASCLADPGLPPETEQRLLAVVHAAIVSEEDPRATQWCCQAMDELLGFWMKNLTFSQIYSEMLALGELTLPHAGAPDWKVQAVRDLLMRLVSPPNLAGLVPLLHESATQVAIPQLHALFTLMGRPAAQCVVACLEVEEDMHRRSQLMEALRAIGRNAVPALQDALTSTEWNLVYDALLVLADIGHRPAFPHVVMSLEHADVRVRSAAIRAAVALGEPEEVAEALSHLLEETTTATQLDCLTVLGELKCASAVQGVIKLVSGLKSASSDDARVRLRAVETLGYLGSNEALPCLQALFRKRSLLSAREGSAIRLSAVKAMAAMNTREARETLALVLDQESDEEVRSAIRAILVG